MASVIAAAEPTAGGLLATFPGPLRAAALLRAEPGTKLAAERRNLGLFAAACFLIALLGYVLIGGLAGGYRSSDWPNQLILGRLLFTDPGHLYNPAVQAQLQRGLLGPGGFKGSPGGVLRLSSPPWLGLLTGPFAHAGVTGGGLLWSLFQLACLLLGLGLLARDRTAVLYAAVSIPTWVMLANANPVGLVVLGLALSRRLLDRHPWLAGLALGLALIRPNVLIPLPFAFLVTRDWRALAGSAFALLALIASVEIIHPGLTVTWMTTVIGQAGHIGPDLTPAGIGWALGGHAGWAFAFAGLAAGLVLTRGRGPGLYAACLLASPHALVQSLVLVSAGITERGRPRLSELALLNLGSVALLMLRGSPPAVAAFGTALLLVFLLMLKDTRAAASETAVVPMMSNARLEAARAA